MAMRYSFNPSKDAVEAGEVAVAQKNEINASYKDLCAVCDAIRYLKADRALNLLESVMNMEMPIAYRRHNKHMGSRHELGGKKGKYPQKAAGEVRLVLINAMANAGNRGNLDAEKMFVIHAAANKTHIERRSPSKGSLAWGRGMYGQSAMMHSDIEYAKVEIGLASEDYQSINENMKRLIAMRNRARAVKEKGKEVRKERVQIKKTVAKEAEKHQAVVQQQVK